MAQGASPHWEPFSTMVASQQSAEVRPRLAPMVAQSSPPHSPHSATQHAAPLGDSTPVTPLLHVSWSDAFRSIVGDARREEGRAGAGAEKVSITTWGIRVTKGHVGCGVSGSVAGEQGGASGGVIHDEPSQIQPLTTTLRCCRCT